MIAILLLLLQVEPATGPLLDSIGARIEARLQANEAGEDQRYHGIRGLLEELRDRPQPDHTALFPVLNSLVKESKDSRAEQVKSVGPIREALQLVSNLVSGLIVLVVLVFAFDIYKTIAKRA